MRRESMLMATALLIFLLSTPLSFAATPCSSCFATYISATESGGTVDVILFAVNQTTTVTEGLEYFDEATREFLSGDPSAPDFEETSLVHVSSNITPVENASIYFYYYTPSGEKKTLEDETGNMICAPVRTNLTKTLTYTDTGVSPPVTKTMLLPYSTCTIPYNLYSGSSIAIYIEFKGDQQRKPSQYELMVYDINAGGINALADALEANVKPDEPQCLAGLVMLGILLASMYFSGKSPLSYMDISTPRIPKPKAYAFGGLTASTMNIRLGMMATLNRKHLEGIVKLHSATDFRKSNINQSILNEIKASKASAIQKYFAKLQASRGGDWESALKTEDMAIVSRLRQMREPPEAVKFMQQLVDISKVSASGGIIGGEKPKKVTMALQYVTKIPLIGTFLGVATSSSFYGIKRQRDLIKAVASAPARKIMGAKYEELGKKKTEELKWSEKKLLDIAAFTDPSKMKLGQLFQLHEYVDRFYADTRDAMYEEIIKNIVWHEAYEQLKKKLSVEKLHKMLDSQMNFKNIFTDHGFIEALGSVKLGKYMHILENTEVSNERRAQDMIAALKSSNPKSAVLAEAEALFNKVRGIDHSKAEAYDKAEELVKHMRDRYKVHEPYDVSKDILGGKFFVMSGRNNLFYEERGERKNFSFITMGLNEFIGQLISVSSMLKSDRALSRHDYEFSLADGFKLAWLKFTSHVFGHGEWYKLSDADIDIHDPVTGKPRKANYLKDVLGINEGQFKGIRSTSDEYFRTFLTKHGKETMTKEGLKTHEEFLYGYKIQKQRKKEETTLLPWKRQQWYDMSSEHYPDQEFWRADMNFLWTTKAAGVDHRLTLLHEVRGEKFWANIPRPEEAWHLTERHMDKRVAEMMNGTQLDFFSHEKKAEQQLKRFSRPDMYKQFNETWEFYSNVKRAYAGYYESEKKTTGATTKQIMDFLKDPANRQITYKKLAESNTPFIYTHDFSYVPYVKGMSVSDFDRIVNGTFVLQDAEGMRRFNFNNKGKYYDELMKARDPQHAALAEHLNSVGKLKMAPALKEVEALEKEVKGLALSSSVKSQLDAHIQKIKELSNPSADIRQYAKDFEAASRGANELRTMLKGLTISEADRFRLMRIMEGIHPDLQPMRSLTQTEINNVKKALEEAKNVPAEHKLTFLYEFSRMTGDWQTLWNAPEMNFFKLVATKDAPIRPESRVGKALSSFFGEEAAQKLYSGTQSLANRFVQSYETAIGAVGMKTAEAQAALVSVSELYRERGADLRTRIKAGGYLDKADFSAEDKAMLNQSYDDYANAFHRFFVGWMDSVTRDPRGSSTQWGRQWYLASMYHRGGAMHTESQAAGGERTFLSPMGWFFSQTFHKASVLNWMIASPIVRMMRSFQTATYGYPTMWDKNITPEGINLMEPWATVNYTSYQRWRSLLNPAESVFALGSFNPKKTASRFMGLVPGMSMMSYFFPSLEKEGKSLEQMPGYNAMLKIPGMKTIMEPSLSQKTWRSGEQIRDGAKQKPEDFMQYKGGAALHHFTDTANPGISYVDYTGRGILAARIASFLTRDIGGANAEAWRKYYGEDEYLRKQSTFSMARRGIAAEAKRLAYQEEFTGYGPWQNPMWAPVSIPTLGYWGWKWLKSSKTATALTALTAAASAGVPGAIIAAGPAAAYQYNQSRKRSQAERERALARGEQPKTVVQRAKDTWNTQYVEFRTDVHKCPHCNSAMVARGANCRICGKHVR